jgi:hypothetical protein
MFLQDLRNLRLHAASSAVLSVLLVLVWALTPHSQFWPQYAIVPVALALGVHAWFELLAARPGILERLGGSRALAAHLGLSAALWIYLVALWASGPGYFWPAWALLGLGLAAGAHAAVVLASRAPEGQAEGYGRK